MPTWLTSPVCRSGGMSIKANMLFISGLFLFTLVAAIFIYVGHRRSSRSREHRRNIRKVPIVIGRFYALSDNIISSGRRATAFLLICFHSSVEPYNTVWLPDRFVSAFNFEAFSKFASTVTGLPLLRSFP